MKLPKGYFKVPDFVFVLGLTVYALIVLIYLCRRSDKYGVSFPSLNLIGKDCGIKSRTTVIKAIKELEELRLIEKIESGSEGRANRYRLSNTIIDITRKKSINNELINSSSYAEQPSSNNGHKPVHNMNTKEYTKKENKKNKENTCKKEIKNKNLDSPNIKQKNFSKDIDILRRRASGENIDLPPYLQKLRCNK